MGEGQPVLRSKDPAGVMQEMWALFAVYQAVCRIAGIAVNAAGVPPAQISFPHAWPPRRTPWRLFPPDQLELTVATFLLKILMPGFRVRDRPDRNSPRRSRKAGDFPARKPGEPSVTKRRAENRVPPAQPLAGHLSKAIALAAPLADKADCFTDRLLASPQLLPRFLILTQIRAERILSHGPNRHRDCGPCCGHVS